MQEIAIRVTLHEQDRLGLSEYERLVGSVATVAALVAWLPTPDARLVLRGRTAEPVRVETVSYGAAFEMLVVLDQRAASVERAASAVAALIESVRHEHVEDDVAGVAGELDRLDRSAPRGRSVAERALRGLLEGARADVLARRTSARVRAASALVRLAEDGATLTVERVADPLAAEVVETPVEAPDTAAAGTVGSVVLPEPVDGVVDLRVDPAVPAGALPLPRSGRPVSDADRGKAKKKSKADDREKAKKKSKADDREKAKKKSKADDREKAEKKKAEDGKKAKKKSAKKSGKKSGKK